MPDWIIELLTGSGTAQQPSGGSQGADRRPLARYEVRRPASYVAAAVAGEIAHVQAAQPGSRNQTLFCAAVPLGQLVGADLIDEHTVRDRLRHACTNHLSAGAFTTVEANATVTSGLTRGKTQPRTRKPRRVA